jgi:imidazolonepropionase-like amidohydrolase
MLITAGRVLTDPASGTYVPDGAVLINGDTIVAAGPRPQVEAQARPDEERLAYPEATLLPGLIDAHVHLLFDASPDPKAVLEHDDEKLLDDMQGRAETLLRSGVTTVRDLGDRNGLALRLADAIDNGSATGARIVSAATPLTPVGGHCWFLGGEVSGASEIRRLIERNVASGAQVIKVMATGGGLTKDGPASWEPQFTPDQLAVVVDEAHQAGLPVAAHAHGVDGIAAAADAGVDTIEHCTWMTPDRNFELREDVLAQIVSKGIYVCPTITPKWKMLPQVFSAERFETISGNVKRMAEAGARLIAGTDAGVQRAQFGGLATSLGFYERLELPASYIIDMATGQAAQALGLGKEIGRLATGYRADLLVVDGDPLKDLGALQRVKTVFAGGDQYEPENSAC